MVHLWEKSVRIVSSFKDYYDSALSLGSDLNLVYDRRDERHEFRADTADRKSWMPRNLDQALRAPLELVRRLPCTFDRHLEIPVVGKVIGFCGLLHPAIEIDGTTYYRLDQIVDGISEAFLGRFGLNRKKVDILFARKLAGSMAYYEAWCRKPLTHDLWEKTVESFVGKRFDDAFIEAGVPVFKLELVAANDKRTPDTIRCTLNPYLRPDSFQKVKTPWEAFQEISMYLGNELARQLDPVSMVSDDVLRDEKGFDEWSFRRHREEGRKYRKKTGTGTIQKNQREEGAQ